jgi:AcrR family transcriptional regulator
MLPASQSLRSQLKRLTKERLISSAIELFRLNGFRATSVGDIAKAAGTTPTTFYRYFSSKSDIACLLQDHINIDVKKTFERLDEVKVPTAIANEESKTRFQIRLVLMYLLMDRLLYLVDIQGRNSRALKMLEEFSEIFRGALFTDGK